MTLPPTLYWSAQLAARSDDTDLAPGVIDASTSVFYGCVEGEWRVLADLPPDAVLLVLDHSQVA